MATCILQARLSSTRLPGKVLRPLMGAPMLERQIERLNRSRRITQLIVATSLEPSDDSIERLCHRLGVSCFRGNLNDVLGRFVEAAKKFPDAHYGRSTSDCPLIDPGIVDRIIEEHLKSGADYTSNTLVPTYPDGLDFEVFSKKALETADAFLKDLTDREHVLSAMHRHPQVLNMHNVATSPDLSAKRWTVDEARDFEFVEAIYKQLYETNSAFSWKDVLNLLSRQPELETINNGLTRNANAFKETSHG